MRSVWRLEDCLTVCYFPPGVPACGDVVFAGESGVVEWVNVFIAHSSHDCMIV